jgi:hypothetical protein
LNTAIYYPNLYPPLKWLRIAALCWDTVYNIEPVDAPARPQAIADLDRELGGGFLEALTFDRPIRDRELMNEFAAWVEENANRFRDQPLMEERDRLAGDLSYFYPGKLGGVDAPIVDQLQQLGLARIESKRAIIELPDWEASWHGMEVIAPEPEPGSPGWEYQRLRDAAWSTDDPGQTQRLRAEAEALRESHLVSVDEVTPRLLVPRELGLYYISLCASYLAARERRDLATTAERFTHVVVSSSRETAAADITQAIVKAYVPADIDQIEPARLAELRETLRHERHACQADVQRLLDEFQRIASEGQLAKLRDDAVELARTRIEATRRAHKHANLELAVEVMGVSLAPPALLATTASLIGIGLFAPLGIAAALGVGTAKAYLAWRRRAETQQKTEWSYIFRLQNALRS